MGAALRQGKHGSESEMTRDSSLWSNDMWKWQLLIAGCWVYGGGAGCFGNVTDFCGVTVRFQRCQEFWRPYRVDKLYRQVTCESGNLVTR
jgi:hypothetical protein